MIAATEVWISIHESDLTVILKHHMHGHSPYVFDYWADPVAQLLVGTKELRPLLVIFQAVCAYARL